MVGIFKTILFLYIGVKSIILNDVNFTIISSLLVLISSNIYREKYRNLRLLLVFEFFVILLLTRKYSYFFVLYSYIVYDIILLEFYIFLVPVTFFNVIFLFREIQLEYLTIIALFIYFAFVIKDRNKREERYKKSFDEERRLRLELERTKAQLIKSIREVKEMSELKERDRIARQLHDKLGHSIAGILFQLRAMRKLVNKDINKAIIMLDNSIMELSNTLNTIRETVHNMKASKNIGIEDLKNLMEKFNFCKVDYKLIGDFNRLDTYHYEVLITIVREALTNATKYSKANNIEIKIEVLNRILRIYIKDDGIGCQNIKEGMGIKTLRDLVENMGGNVSIDGMNGFLMVCVIPLND
ncbi:histidine kinase [Caloramator sp. CAR-1]|jgi:signal transduction histidine kinase|uniref:sensor histidine kinase n=1 Tax=Caloramator sp. CAR-1 TaxID=3062777 RepID=UPI0026E257BF|nr:histidine kinase [Caloramator sp. CAR-1]MDO6355512.1 histidine kinase [Caloramator sp. CAR-1]